MILGYNFKPTEKLLFFIFVICGRLGKIFKHIIESLMNTVIAIELFFFLFRKLSKIRNKCGSKEISELVQN